MVQPEPNGFPFDPTFESWKPISTTDRGDNNTFRFILGNDVAVKAAQTGNISPWPDGARFAKIAWQQEPARWPGAPGQVRAGRADGEERPGYKDTEGWGWGRWRGLDLKPYGKDAHFVNECTGCHQPLRGNDYVYTLPITPAKVSGDEVVNNAAALPASLPYQPLAGAPSRCMSILRPHDGDALRQRRGHASRRGTQGSGGCGKGPGVSGGCGAGARHLGTARRSALVRRTHSRSPQSVEFVQVMLGLAPAEYRQKTEKKW
jgi:hypothetical protein